MFFLLVLLFYSGINAANLNDGTVVPLHAVVFRLKNFTFASASSLPTDRSDLRAGFFAVGYGSYLGKKIDPEPGRCRRTDGKKWRCAKEAASDSKYCERHMHRGRNRSRKPVETQLVPHSLPPPAASAVPPLAALTNGNNGFHNHSLYPAIGGNNGGCGGNNMSSTFSSALGSSPLHMGNASPYAALGGGGGTCKDLR